MSDTGQAPIQIHTNEEDGEPMNPIQTRPRTIIRFAAAFAVIAALLTIGVAEAEASTYTVRECTAINGYPFGATPDISYVENTGSYPGTSSCTVGGFANIVAAAATNQGRYTVYQYDAPLGTQFDDYSFGISYQQGDSTKGNRPQIFERRVGQAQQTVTSVNVNGSSTYTHTRALSDGILGVSGPRNRIGIGMSCAPPAGCQAENNTHIRMWGNYFAMRDTSPPQQASIAGTIFSGWVSGSKSIDVAHTDVGAGVEGGNVYGPGGAISLNDYCSPAQTGDLTVGSMSPCSQTRSDSFAVNLASNPAIQQGANTITVCTTEFGTNPAQSCNTRVASVDTVAPTAPSGVSVSGGEAWKRDNDFDLSWSNPAQAHAPITAARVRITGPGGYDQTVNASGLEAAGNLSVPAVGEYTASVYLVDAAGNENANAVARAPMRFDDTVPVRSQPDIANGWISRRDRASGYLQGWQRPTAGQTPPSGVAGYRVVINANSDTDPCSGGVDPRACGGPITHQGIDNIAETFGAGDLVEGTNWVHVAPVSGSGMRATQIGHTALKVDLTDPTTTLSGALGGWTNQDVRIEATAADALSGMVDSAEFPDDAPPATSIKVDGSPIVSDADRDVATVISAEGSHQVQYWARDLAGNVNDGADGNNTASTTTVRIDKTAPVAGFTNRQDPADPDQLAVPVSDPLSGIAAGQIDYRAVGGEWKSLSTKVVGSELRARIDSSDMKEETTYEFRATVTDRAGNEARTTRREDGTEMTQSGPFRTASSIAEIKIDGKRKLRAGYSAQPILTGRLIDKGGQPIADAIVEIAEDYAAGSKRPDASFSLRTDAKGGFRVKLRKGPSRTLSAHYAGDKRILPSSSEAVVMKVRGRVGLTASRSRVQAGGRIAFSGQIRARKALVPKAGKRLEVQVLSGSKWRTVGRSIRSDKRGRYELRYRFGSFYTVPTTFTFRALVLKEEGWPYLPAKSKKIQVTVVP